MHVEPYADHDVDHLVAAAALERGRVPALVAVDGGEVVGTVRTIERPDRRTFVQLTGTLTARSALMDAVDDPRPCLTVTESDDHERAMAERLGFTIETVMEDFLLPFARVDAFMNRSWQGRRTSIVSVLEVPVDVVASLDTELRGAVPGVDGWVSTEAFMQDEFEDEDFDPDAYLVGFVDGEPAGLVRIWRTDAGPKFGLVGVLPAYRSTTLAAALSARALRAASTWGHDVVLAGASTSNPVTHPLLVRLGALSAGRSLQMRRG